MDPSNIVKIRNMRQYGKATFTHLELNIDPTTKNEYFEK